MKTEMESLEAIKVKEHVSIEDLTTDQIEMRRTIHGFIDGRASLEVDAVLED